MNHNYELTVYGSRFTVNGVPYTVYRKPSTVHSLLSFFVWM